MKAVLDHIGISVTDLDAALTFYRDALGLNVEAIEEVSTERVRACFLPVGEVRLELLEATAPDSAIARAIEKRGPGLHHITLRVENLAATLADLRARGVRLVDEKPRAGAEGASVAFIHPSSARGVLIELKQPGTAVVPTVSRYTIGELELISLHDGFFRLDGGAMFGTIPKPLWAAQSPADERNRIMLSMRPLVVRGRRTLLIDAGIGDKDSEKFREMYGVDRRSTLERSLNEAGLSVDSIDLVLATHLHFDHAGGFTVRMPDGRIKPHFPRARYVVRRGEWDDATHPHERNRASYLADNFVPLAEAGVLEFVDDDTTIMPGVRVCRTGGHTKHHQMVWIESGGRHAAFVADLMPTTVHLPLAWIMGYDLFPVETLAEKKRFISEALTRDALVFFEHDPVLAAGHLVEENGKRKITPAAPSWQAAVAATSSTPTPSRQS